MSNKFKLQQLSEALVIITSYRYDLFKSLKYFCIKQPFLNLLEKDFRGTDFFRK